MRKYAPIETSDIVLEMYRTLLSNYKVGRKSMIRFMVYIKTGCRRGAMAEIARYEGVSREAVRQSIKKCNKIIAEVQ